jgi:histidinol dehydrogenase
VAGLLEVDALLVAGGAQAVGALAFGWSATPGDPPFEPVDRIVGPGNPWVIAAKLEVAGIVGIDLPAGPSEGMVLADDAADPVIAAADLVTQAEHGPDSPATLVTTSRTLADAVEREVAALVATLDRRDVITAALSGHGAIAIAPDEDAAIAFVDAYAPEHLSIHTRDPEAVATRIRHAGSIFVGAWAPESAGDYATGANHVLPTGGLARACDPLAVEAFGRWTQIQYVHAAGLAAIRETVGRLATVEGMTAHRHAVEVRFAPAAARDATTARDATGIRR